MYDFLVSYHICQAFQPEHDNPTRKISQKNWCLRHYKVHKKLFPLDFLKFKYFILIRNYIYYLSLKCSGNLLLLEPMVNLISLNDYIRMSIFYIVWKSTFEKSHYVQYQYFKDQHDKLHEEYRSINLQNTLNLTFQERLLGSSLFLTSRKQ